MQKTKCCICWCKPSVTFFFSGSCSKATSAATIRSIPPFSLQLLIISFAKISPFKFCIAIFLSLFAQGYAQNFSEAEKFRVAICSNNMFSSPLMPRTTETSPSPQPIPTMHFCNIYFVAYARNTKEPSQTALQDQHH